MKIIITEGQFTRLNKSSQGITNAIIKYMNEYIVNGERKITKKSRNYGNLREDWCINGKEIISAHYYFEEGEFKYGSLSISKKIVESLSNLLSIRRSYVIHVIEEWYDETMVPKFEKIMGVSGLSIDEMDTLDKEHDCIDEPTMPEGITDYEMIDYIVKHTLYTKDNVINKIESGERDLEDFFLDILDSQNRKKSKGF
jgi:hypothetical protein